FAGLQLQQHRSLRRYRRRDGHARTRHLRLSRRGRLLSRPPVPTSPMTAEATFGASARMFVPWALRRPANMSTGNPEADSRPITQILAEWSAGESEALRQLLPLVYSRLLELAESFMRRQRPGHTLQPTALVGELYLRLAAASPPDLESREHFY